MNHKERLAYTQIRAAMEGMQQRGFDEAKVMESAVKAASKRFSDPEDAAYMLRRFIRDRDTSVPNAPTGTPEISTKTEQPSLPPPVETGANGKPAKHVVARIPGQAVGFMVRNEQTGEEVMRTGSYKGAQAKAKELKARAE